MIIQNSITEIHCGWVIIDNKHEYTRADSIINLVKKWEALIKLLLVTNCVIQSICDVIQIIMIIAIW